jgi:hypothetical protein
MTHGLIELPSSSLAFLLPPRPVPIAASASRALAAMSLGVPALRLRNAVPLLVAPRLALPGRFDSESFGELGLRASACVGRQ